MPRANETCNLNGHRWAFANLTRLARSGICNAIRDPWRMIFIIQRRFMLPFAVDFETVFRFRFRLGSNRSQSQKDCQIPSHSR